MKAFETDTFTLDDELWWSSLIHWWYGYLATNWNRWNIYRKLKQKKNRKNWAISYKSSGDSGGGVTDGHSRGRGLAVDGWVSCCFLKTKKLKHLYFNYLFVTWRRQILPFHWSLLFWLPEWRLDGVQQWNKYKFIYCPCIYRYSVNVQLSWIQSN